MGLNHFGKSEPISASFPTVRRSQGAGWKLPKACIYQSIPIQGCCCVPRYPLWPLGVKRLSLMLQMPFIAQNYLEKEFLFGPMYNPGQKLYGNLFITQTVRNLFITKLLRGTLRKVFELFVNIVK